MITWIIEENVFSEQCFNDMISYCNNNDIPYHTIKVIPFAHTIVDKAPIVKGKVVVYGSIGIQKVAKDHGWEPGVWFDEDMFNYKTYNEKLGNMMLNDDATIIPISQFSTMLELLYYDSIGTFFIKPNSDTKEFAGQLMKTNEFEDWYQNLIEIGYLDSNDFDVIIATPKKIIREWRVIVVDKKIVTSSIYREYGVTRLELQIIPDVISFVNKAIEKFNPAPIYAIDIAETSEGFKVIEYNNFNNAGLYACDIGYIIEAVNRYIENED